MEGWYEAAMNFPRLVGPILASLSFEDGDFSIFCAYSKNEASNYKIFGRN